MTLVVMVAVGFGIQAIELMKNVLVAVLLVVLLRLSKEMLDLQRPKKKEK